jgi:hypothetical protein
MSSADTQRAKRRAEWLNRPPTTSDPWYAFRSVAHRWVDGNPQSRENTMRSILERLFDQPFPKVRPNFLRSPVTKRCLELDAYCEELKLAAEMNGIGHSVWPNPFHDTRDKFEAQLERDARKAQLCAQYGIKLVVVPHEVSRDELEAYLMEQFHPELAARAAAAAAAAAATAAAAVTVTAVVTAATADTTATAATAITAAAAIVT